ncbi:MAG: ATP-dependent RecD-like DNA helicase [Faecousia sp.]
MEFVVCALVIVILILWNKMRKLKRDAQESEKKQQNMIENQKEALLAAMQETERARAQSANQAKEIQSLKATLAETKRILDFYKNIEEDSGNLNAPTDTQERRELLEQVAQQIISDKDQSTGAAFSQGDTKALLDAEQSLARNEMENSRRNYFITGKAGTGKSFLLDVFRKTTSKSHIVLAPTGIAALNVGGATLHATFGYHNLVNLDVDSISEKTIRLKSEKKMILKQVSTIIIDEISMVRADTFEKIDRILRVINSSDLPFGGKQMLLFGDLFQLPPVAQAKEMEFLHDKYGGIHFFCAKAYKQGDFQFFELTINHRQKEDADYFALLNRIRDGSTTAADIAVLNSKVVQDMSVYDRFTSLLPTKAEVERLNQNHLAGLDSKEYVYTAKITLDKYPGKNHNLESVFPVANSLRLKKGALVMMVANDSEHRWVNGTLGIVSKLSESSIFVAIDKRVYEVSPVEFSEQEVTYADGRIQYEDVLKVVQYPIVLAYAITIHKSQGQTYQNIVCDIDRCFANGQAYVALSRCASLDGLHLKQRVSGGSIRVDSSVLDFYRKQTNMTRSLSE